MNRPNIIYILADQQHYQAAGCVDPFYHTPNWDALAAEGVRFETVYCTTPLCTPSRAAFLTGLGPEKTGIRDNGQELRHPTIATALQAAGYQTAWIGKWHLKEHPDATAGWDYKQGVYNEYQAPNRPLSDDEVRDFTRQYLAEVDTSEKPFALFVSFDQPHGVYWIHPKSGYPPSFLEEPEPDDATRLPRSWHEQDFSTAPIDEAAFEAHQRNTTYRFEMGEDERAWKRYREVYRACVKSYDARLGQVLDALKEGGFYDESLIIATSDHGDMDAHHRLCFKGPVPYDQIQRVPLAIRLPNAMNTGPGRVDDSSLVSLIDLPATLCDFAEAQPDWTLDGISLRPVLTGQRAIHSRERAVIHYPNPQLITVREGPWKFTRYPGRGDFLYHLAHDPDELHNLAGPPENLPAWADPAECRSVLQKLVSHTV